MCGPLTMEVRKKQQRILSFYLPNSTLIICLGAVDA